MLIQYRCPCGQLNQVPDKFAGKEVLCPRCHNASIVPYTAPVPAANPTPAAPGGQGMMVGNPRPWARDQADPNNPFDFGDAPLPSQHEIDTREAAARFATSENPEGRYATRGSGGGSASVLGGIAMMLIAVIWFVVGIVAADLIFFYPPVLFVIGLVTVIKGSTSS